MELDEKTGKVIPKLLVKDSMQVESHKILAGNSFIKASSSGLNTVLPYGERVMEKLIRLIDGVMQQPGPMDQCANGVKVAMPCMSHKKGWEMTGRWENFGSEMYRLMDRKGSDYCLAPTHEEVVTDLFDSSSFPARIYQIGRKFRDESWPKHGLLRAKEFMMKDMYSFDRDVESATVSYNVLVKAYKSIFDKLELDYLVVEGDTGQIGGSMSHEFHAISQIGEDKLLHCKCSSSNDSNDTGNRYAANVEMARSIIDEKHLKALNSTMSRLVKDSASSVVSTTISRSDLNGLLHSGEFSLFKVAIERAVKGSDPEHALVLAVLPAGSDMNEVKAKKLLGASCIAVFPIAEVSEDTHSPYESILIDRSLISLCETIEPKTGENKEVVLHVGDSRTAKQGELCCNSKNPNCCHSQLYSTNGIEIGHVFYLGTTYSSVFNVRCTDNSGKNKLAEMGCYGIGVSRVMQAVVEASHDKFGPIWPFAVAPYRAIVINSFPSKENRSAEEMQTVVQEVYDHSVKVYESLNKIPSFRGEVLYYDDMRARMSEKLRYAESVGIPYAILIGNNFLKTGKYEVKNRKTGEVLELTPEETTNFFNKIHEQFDEAFYYGF